MTAIESADPIRRLRLARLLVQQAEDHARVDHESRNAACVMSLQDAVETVLLVVAQHVGATFNKAPDFDKYFVSINEKIAPASLPMKLTLERLNKMRVQAKHHGFCPSHSDSEPMVGIVKAFLSEVCEAHLQVDWRTANLSHLVRNLEQRGLLEQSEKALAEKRYVEALISARKAMFLAFEQEYDISGFRDGNYLNALSFLGWRAPNWARSPEYIRDRVGDPFGYIVIDSAVLDADLVKLGVDPVSFWNIRRITPEVYRLSDGTWLLKRELAKTERSDAEADAVYAVDAVADMILRKEARERRTKSISQPGLWNLRTKPGASVYAKASIASQVLLTCVDGITLRVEAETVGFNGEEGWWEVAWFSPQWGRGYLREEDVDRSDG